MNLIPIMLAAGAEIMRIYDTDFEVAAKGDASPVTAADEAAEAIILKGLSEIAPEVPVVAEESAAAGHIPATAARFFLVDPLDGTKEFVNRNGEFTVNIALIENGRAVMGSVYAPALGKIFWGAEGEGAFMAEVVDGVPGPARQLTVSPASEEGVRAVGSRSHGGEATAAYLESFKVSGFVSAGSSLKFCLIAEGAADIYPRMGRTMEWDTAAGDAVLRAAGGRVETLDGEDLLYGKRVGASAQALAQLKGDSDFANPYFVAFGNAAIKV